MTTVREPPAKSNAMLDQQIAALELRLKRNRNVSRQRSHALWKGMRDSLTSPLALLISVGAGFAAHRFDLFHRPKPRVAAATKHSASDSVIGGMVRGFSLAASLIALMPDAPPRQRSEATGDEHSA